MSKSSKPLIGISLDLGNHNKPGSYSKYPWYALRTNYSDEVVAAGGVPILLPYHLDLVETYAQQLDGLLIPGGDFDIHPSYYGVETVHERVTVNPGRTSFEFALAKAMKAQEKPILGICGGMQLLNVIFGGTLIQHIPDEINNCLAHEQSNPRCEAGHHITITPQTLLHELSQSEISVPVNSAHHQAIKNVAPGFIVNAQAPDGVIEGIEYANSPDDQENKTFIMGVQWHPEFRISDLDTKIFHHFVQSASTRKSIP